MLAVYRRGRITLEEFDRQLDAIAAEEADARARLTKLDTTLQGQQAVATRIVEAAELLRQLRAKSRGPWTWEKQRELDELPRSKLRGIKPPLAYSHGPPVWRGGCSCILRVACMRTLEQPQLDVLAMQLRIAFFTALLPHILANDFFIPVPAYSTDEIAFGPKLASPQTFFDGRNAVKDLTSRETFDDLDNLGRAIARH